MSATHFKDLHEFYFERNALARIAADSPQRSEDLERKAGIAPKRGGEMNSAKIKKPPLEVQPNRPVAIFRRDGFCFEFILRFLFQICRRNDILGTCKRHVV